MTTVALGVGLLALAVVLYWLGVAVHGALEGRRFPWVAQMRERVSRFLDGPWWRVAAVWWVSSTVLVAAGAWVFWIHLDGVQWRAGDWRDLAIFWALFSGVILAAMARVGRRSGGTS
jgi:hypothetical protein